MVAKIEEPEKNAVVFRLPKRIIKTLLTDDNDNASDSQVIIRKQFVGTTNSSGAVSFSAGTNETFASFTSTRLCTVNINCWWWNWSSR